MPEPAKLFEYFSKPSERRDAAEAREITGILEAMWEEVRQIIGPERFDPALGEIRAGRFTVADETAWAQTNDERESGFVNLTLEAEQSELSLNLIGWFDPQLEQVEAWLRRPKAWRFLREHPEWNLLVFVRRANVGKSGRAVFRGAPGEEIDRLDLSEVSPVDITTRLSGLRPRLGEDEKLALHVRRSWGPDEVERPDFPTTLAEEVEAWLGPLGEIRLA